MGLKQGNCLSPIMFLLLVETLLCQINKQNNIIHPHLHTYNIYNQTQTTICQAYADDIVIWSDNTQQLQLSNNILTKWATDAHMIINKNKSTITSINTHNITDQDKQIIHNTNYTITESFTYLGISITPNLNEANTLPKIMHYLMANLPKMQHITKVSTWIQAYKTYLQSAMTYFIPYIHNINTLTNIDNAIIRHIKSHIIQQDNIGQYPLQALMNITLPSYIHKQAFINVYNQWCKYTAIGFHTHIQKTSKYTTHFINMYKALHIECEIITRPTILNTPIHITHNTHINTSTSSLCQVHNVNNNNNNNNTITFYTDASQTRNKDTITSYAILVSNQQLQTQTQTTRLPSEISFNHLRVLDVHTDNLPSTFTIYQAEFYAIIRAVWMAPINFNIHIYTDSNSVIQHLKKLRKLKSQHKDTLTQLYEHLITIRTQHHSSTKLHYIKAHEPIITNIHQMGNAIVDFAAQSLTGPIPNTTKSIEATRSYTQYHIRNNHNLLNLHQINRLYKLRSPFQYHIRTHETYKTDCKLHITTLQQIKQLIKDDIRNKANLWISKYTKSQDTQTNIQCINRLHEEIMKHKHKHKTKQHIQMIITTIEGNRNRP